MEEALHKTAWCAGESKGKLFTTRPSRYKMTDRRRTWTKSDCLVAPCASRDAVEKTVEMPTRKRKVGKTRSVGVKPFHAACFRGQ